MNLQTFLAEGKLRSHKTSAGEVAGLLRVVERDLADAKVEQLSHDRRFTTAYNAALQLANQGVSVKFVKLTDIGCLKFKVKLDKTFFLDPPAGE